MKRDLIALKDYRPEEITGLLDLADELKRTRALRDDLKGKTLALIFQKPSNRTRVSFEVGIRQLGGNCIYLGPEEINLGVRETTADVAKTLSRYVDGLVARTFSHKDVVDLAEHATVPVINGLCDLYHPCQALADLMAIRERFKAFQGITLAYIGDGNNVCHSLMIGCAKIGMNMKIAAPKGYEPNPAILKNAQAFAKGSGAKIEVLRKPEDAARGAQVIYADVWVSMGQEKEAKKRLKDLKGYQINAKLAKLADPNYIFMHCLPAHRGQEVTEDVIDGPHSIIFDQAENRLHAQKAVLVALLGKR
ncbi:MAG: ornithine carbamoyltransferase [Candidatus Omnitrophota bacterium]|nr:ornithine carbamoyltransferase [Candidatus Omnitrophota bacterium]MDZ4241512.1 ornithine carbamoyltransferase [Candidatus Omnitrophota bacterium]